VPRQTVRNLQSGGAGPQRCASLELFRVQPSCPISKISSLSPQKVAMMLSLAEVEDVLQRSESGMKMRTTRTKTTKLRNVQRRSLQSQRNLLLRALSPAVAPSFPSLFISTRSSTPVSLSCCCFSLIYNFLSCPLLLSALVALINPLDSIPDESQTLLVFGLPFGSTLCCLLGMLNFENTGSLFEYAAHTLQAYSRHECSHSNNAHCPT
jgi:hypothetical protein